MDGDCPMEKGGFVQEVAERYGRILKRKRKQRVELKGGGACVTRATTGAWPGFAYGFMHQSQPKYVIMGLRVRVILDLAPSTLLFFFFFPLFYFSLSLICTRECFFTFLKKIKRREKDRKWRLIK